MNKLEEINTLIKSSGIRISWLSNQLGMKTQTLNFLLNNSEKTIDDELYMNIKKNINSFQMEFNFYNNENFDSPDLFDDKSISIGMGARIRIFARKKYGSASKLSKELGISPQHLQLYINGKREPGAKILIKFLKIGCDLNWLLGGTEKIESYRIIKLENELRKLNLKLQQITDIVAK